LGGVPSRTGGRGQVQGRDRPVQGGGLGQQRRGGGGASPADPGHLSGPLPQPGRGDRPGARVSGPASRTCWRGWSGRHLHRAARYPGLRARPRRAARRLPGPPCRVPRGGTSAASALSRPAQRGAHHRAAGERLMVYLAAGSWMLVMAILGDRARLRDHVVTLGLGLGALLAALLFAVPAAGTALATAMPSFGARDILRELFVTQVAWVATAVVG